MMCESSFETYYDDEKKDSNKGRPSVSAELEDPTKNILNHLLRNKTALAGLAKDDHVHDHV